MNQKSLKVVFLIVSIFLVATVSFGQGKDRRHKGRNDKLITAMINAEEIRGIFGDDAMYLYSQAPEIQAIFALGPNAIPLLIAHLDDKRLLGVSTSQVSFNETNEFTVTVGAACFDLLTYIIRDDKRFFDKSCIKDLDDGSEGHVSFCAVAKYAVFPEDFWAGRRRIRGNLWHGKGLIVPKSVIRAKRNWRIAYLKHQVHYVKFEG